MRPDPDPLGSWWYADRVHVWRCKICQRPREEPHGPTCALGRVITLVTALLESEDPMSVEDTDLLFALGVVVDVPVRAEFD
jgi:hypothetical protein